MSATSMDKRQASTAWHYLLLAVVLLASTVCAAEPRELDWP